MDENDERPCMYCGTQVPPGEIETGISVPGGGPIHWEYAHIACAMKDPKVRELLERRQRGEDE